MACCDDERAKRLRAFSEQVQKYQEEQRNSFTQFLSERAKAIADALLAEQDISGAISFHQLPFGLGDDIVMIVATDNRYAPAVMVTEGTAISASTRLDPHKIHQYAQKLTQTTSVSPDQAYNLVRRLIQAQDKIMEASGPLRRDEIEKVLKTQRLQFKPQGGILPTSKERKAQFKQHQRFQNQLHSTKLRGRK